MANWGCVSFTIIMLLIPVSLLPHGSHTFIYLICILALIFLLICVQFFREYGKMDNSFVETVQIQQLYERREFFESLAQNNIALSMRENRNNAWSMRERGHYIVDLQQINMSFGTIAEIARCAIRALPPVKSFDGDKNTDCPICVDEFTKGEMIQSFGVCGHEFHTACLNSWLLGGKTTCPVCRHDLLSNY